MNRDDKDGISSLIQLLDSLLSSFSFTEQLKNFVILAR